MRRERHPKAKLSYVSDQMRKTLILLFSFSDVLLALMLLGINRYRLSVAHPAAAEVGSGGAFAGYGITLAILILASRLWPNGVQGKRAIKVAIAFFIVRAMIALSLLTFGARDLSNIALSKDHVFAVASACGKFIATNGRAPISIRELNLPPHTTR